MRIVYSGVLLFGSLFVSICSPQAFAQTVTYHLHEESSSTGGLAQLAVSGPDAATASLQSADLKGAPAGEYLIQAFDSQLGDPGASGTIASGTTINFTLYMRKTSSLGTMTPRAKLLLNSAVGTQFCTATGATALTTTVTKISLSCKTSATTTIASSDRFYLWVGVNLTAISSSNTFKVELDIEGTVNGNFDSQVGIPVPAATITSLSPSTGAVGAVISISGTNFGASKGQSTVTFANAKTASPTSWSSTQIVAAVPAGAITGNVAVTVGGKASNGKSFAVVPAPTMTGASPVSGAAGTAVTIAGSNFGSTTPSVKFNGIPALVSSFSASSIATNVPIGATTGNVMVTASGVNSNGVAFTVPAPAIGSLSPASGASGTPFTISGTNFGSIPGTVTLNGQGASVSNWTNTTIAAVVPNNAITGNVVVTSGILNSNGAGFTVAPNVTGLAPGSGEPGATVTISGSNFTSFAGSVSFNGKVGLINSWSNTSISALVPNGATSGNVVVTAGTLQSNGFAFSVLAPAIGNITPSSGTPGSSVIIAGTNFGTNTGTVTFNGRAASVGTWSDTSIVVTVPNGATTGNVVVSNGGLQSGGAGFTVAPIITSVAPVTAEPGAAITITGLNFTPITGTATFNGQTASISSWSDTSIAAVVPNGANSGNVVVTAGTLQSNGQAFSVLGPAITSLTPSSGAPGSSVTIAGTNFGVNAGTVAFNGQTASVGTWSDTSIVVTVPNGATTGSVAVSNGGLQSGGAVFTVAPIIASVAPINAEPGSSITITGLNFTAVTGTVTFNGQTASTSNWSDTSITAVVPNRASNGDIVVIAGTLQSNGQAFSVLGPAITILTPSSGAPGSSVTIAGTNFGANAGTVTFNGQTASVGTWSDTSIIVTVPTGATTGNVVVSNGGLQSGPLAFSVVPTSPIIATISPSSGISGVPVTITGSGFGASQGSSTVAFNSVQAIVVNTWSDTSISVLVPPGTTSGNVVLTVGGQVSNGVPFTIGGYLAGTFAPTVTAVTLTSPNAIDWAHWGTLPDVPLVTSVGILPDFSIIGTVSPVQISDGEIEYSWTDGSAVSVSDRTTTGVSVTGTGNGFHLSIPADVVPQTVLLYVGAWEAQGQLTAILNDNSAPTFSDSSVDIVAANGDHHVNGTYTLTFQATQPGQMLNIDYILQTDHGAAIGLAGYVSLQSAVLLTPKPTIALSSPTDGQTFTYPSDLPLAATAMQVGASISTVSFFSDSQKVFDAATSPYSFALGGLGAGDHTISATATDGNGITATSTPIIISEVSTGGVLTASVDSTVSIDLSAGTSDWVHWGGTILDRKAGVSPQISDLQTLANGSAHFFDAAAAGGVMYSWSSGTATPTQSGTATEMRMQAYNNGFKLIVAADTTLRTLKLYVASGFGESTLRAALSDGSAAPHVSAFSSPAPFVEKVYTIQFQAASGAQTLTITNQVTRDDGFAFVALSSASVTDQNPPRIDSVTPVSGKPGDLVTITGIGFGAAQGNSTISISGAPMNVVTWSDSAIAATIPLVQSGALVVSRGLANSNGVAFTVTLPPPPVISFISPDSGIASSPVTISGSNFGPAQNGSTVTFNGVTVDPASWSDTMVVVGAPAGVHSGPVVVTTVSGASNGVQFTFVPGIRFSLQSVYVTPDESNLEVGGSGAFRMTDPSGSTVTDATWNVDSSALATISPDASSPATAILQALSPGEVTITATSSIGTAQAKATIYAAGTLPVGTAAWGFYPQTQDNSFAATVKSRRINPDDPYLYLAENTFDFTRLDTLDENGRLLQRITLNPLDTSNTFNFPIVAAGTNDGGVLAMTIEAGGPNDPTAAFYRLGPNGQPLWNYSIPTTDVSGPAIGPDGTIYFWQETNSDISLMALDDTAGTARSIFTPNGGTPPIYTSSEQPGPINPDGSLVSTTNPWKPCASFFQPGQFNPRSPAGPGNFSFQPVIGADGSIYVMETGSAVNFNYSSCFIQRVGTDSAGHPVYTFTAMSGQLQYAGTLTLVRLNSSGPVATTQIAAISYSGDAGFTSNGFTPQWTFNHGNSQLPALHFDRVVPNADGGVLMTWAQSSQVQGDAFHGFISNIVSDSPASTNPLPFPGTVGFFNGFGNLATNDLGTVFFDNSGTLTAFDIPSGTPKWTVPGRLIAATDDGGALINNTGSVQPVDANGIVGTATLPIGSASYASEGMFVQNSPSGAVQGVPSNSPDLTKTLAGPWPVPGFANPQQNFKAKGEKTSQLVQKDLTSDQTEGCTGYDAVDIDLPAIMAPASGVNPLTNATVPETGNTFNFRAPKGITMKLVPADTNLLTLSVDDPVHPDKLTATVPGDGGSHLVTLRGHGTLKPPNGIPVLAFNATSNEFLGNVFQGIVAPYHFWQIHEFEIGDASNNTTPGATPGAAQIAGELNRIFRNQANIEFDVTDRGLVNSFHWDKDGDHQMHFASHWDFPLFKENFEAGPLHNYITTTVDGPASPLLTQGWTMYLYYVRDFDSTTTEGFTLLGNRSVPSLVKTTYNLQINLNDFMSNLTAHELGHKLGLIDRVRQDKNYIMDGIRTGTETFRAQNTPCKLSSKEWFTANH